MESLGVEEVGAAACLFHSLQAQRKVILYELLSLQATASNWYVSENITQWLAGEWFLQNNHKYEKKKIAASSDTL